MDGTLDRRALSAVYEVYHRYLIGLVLGLVHRAGIQRAADVTFATFRQRHHEKFLPGLKKLGLDRQPDAVACAQYHYLSNSLGGVKVDWIPESDKKSWVRYLPPRWFFDGVGICGVPTEVSRAMLLAWHANNGVSLGNPKLGFVCTAMTTDGGAGLIGYYVEEERELLPEERLRFSPGELPPDVVAPPPVVDWNEDRLAKVQRNFAIEQVQAMLGAMCRVLGPADAGQIGRIVGKQIGMYFHDIVCEKLDMVTTPSERDARSLADLLARMFEGHGDNASLTGSSNNDVLVQTDTWRFGRGLNLPPEGFEAWNGLWEGMSVTHSRGRMRLDVPHRLDLGDSCTQWRVRSPD